MMPKFSVYVPDDLWEQARAAEPELNPSQLMQTALRRHVGRSAGRPAFTRVRPQDSQALVANVRDQLMQRARQRYEEGYRHGLELLIEVPWEAIDQLARHDWDLNAWARASEESRTRYTPDGETYGQDQAEPYYQTIVAAANTAYTYESTFRMGVTDALQDVWDDITRTESWVQPAETDFAELDDLPFE